MNIPRFCIPGHQILISTGSISDGGIPAGDIGDIHVCSEQRTQITDALTVNMQGGTLPNHQKIIVGRAAGNSRSDTTRGTDLKISTNQSPGCAAGELSPYW